MKELIKHTLKLVVVLILFSCEDNRVKIARTIKAGNTINSVTLKIGSPTSVNNLLYQGDSIIHLRYKLGWGAPDDINIYMNPKDSTVIKIFSESM